ncbi:MAG: nucleotide exchange factor GrpE [Deltaproteobacteria bacterium]|nr:nucleotide exchange factor GrpE [Deltaproteobacteria bacterium]
MKKKNQTKESPAPAGKNKNKAAANVKKQEKAEEVSLTALLEEKEALQQEVEKLRRENQQLQEQVLRVRAEAENFRKRIQREKEDFARYAKEEFIREILPVKDNLERALEHGEACDSQAILKGVHMVLDQFGSIFEKMGVCCFDSLGKPFDPNFHEAMMQQETDEYDDNTVIAEHQKGYLYQDRLLRPAMVTVAKAKGGREEAGPPPRK